MVNRKRDAVNLPGIILFIMHFLILPSILFGGQADDITKSNSNGDVSFVLTIQDNLITLKAKDAPVLEIVKEICRQMEIEIAGEIPVTEKVNMEFEKLTFDEALARFTGRLCIPYWATFSMEGILPSGGGRIIVTSVISVQNSLS